MHIYSITFVYLLQDKYVRIRRIDFFGCLDTQQKLLISRSHA